MIRAKVYSLYNDLIESLYIKDDTMVDKLELDVDETKSVLYQLAQEELGMPLSSVDANFFSEGIDSLKAIHFRRLILQHFNFDQNMTPGQNVVFEAGNISTLATRICAMQQGSEVSSIEDSSHEMTDLVERYSRFQRHIPQPSSCIGTSVVSA
jgi:hypothetical protein